MKNSRVILNEKPLPHAVEIEAVVLGAIILDRQAIYLVIDILKPESFYSKKNQIIYGAILRLYKKSMPIDMLTVTEELTKQNELEKIGGAFYIVELTNRVASAANIEVHARIIQEKYLSRELYALNCDSQRKVLENVDAIELLEWNTKSLFEISSQNSRGDAQTLGSIGVDVLQNIDNIQNNPSGLSGIPSGFSDLDRLTNGWQSSDLIIIAARPGMGKTAFVLSMAANAAMDFDKSVAVFSLEMSNLQLAQRLASITSEVKLSKFRSGEFGPNELGKIQAKVEEFSNFSILLDDTPGLNIIELRAKLTRLKMQYGIDLAIIDYLQLMTGENGKNGNRESEVAAISRSLKGLAKELNIPIIALSQLSRAVEVRGGAKRPQLSDLRESGAIEQDADIVAFIYRPEYYQILEDEEGQSLKGVGEIIIAKNRHGALKTIKLRFVPEYTKFTDLNEPMLITSNDMSNFQSNLNDNIPFE